MALSKTLLVSLLISLFILCFVEASSHSDQMVMKNMVSSFPTVDQIDCGKECNRRCSKSSRPNLCQRACGTCCARCNCVPSGTAGNYDECPCYRDMTTHGGEHKCP